MFCWYWNQNWNQEYQNWYMHEDLWFELESEWNQWKTGWNRNWNQDISANLEPESHMGRNHTSLLGSDHYYRPRSREITESVASVCPSVNAFSKEQRCVINTLKTHLCDYG